MLEFLARMVKEQKINLVEPSDIIANAYLEKSRKTLNSAKTILATDDFENTIALSYYSMYHLLTALLFRIGVKCENHTAAIILLQDVFGIGNESMCEARAERIDKQYYVDFDITEQETKEAIKSAEAFNAMLRDFLARLTQDEIAHYRKKAERIIKTR